MAFTRVRRHLSTLAAGSNNRKARVTTETRSISGSTVNSTLPNLVHHNGVFTNDGNQSITFDKLLTNDEASKRLTLAPRQNSLSAGDFEGRPPETSLGLLPSTTSSRRTTIVVNNSEYAENQEPRKVQVNDSIRLEAEQSYYDSVNPAGTSRRRRSMLRSVSKDDYLLARGANPRTGLVTPGAHSASSSYDEAELLKQRGVAPPSKWRQRGDQWVSLDVGEPTPLPSPPKGSRTAHAGRPLHTPPRLTAGKYNHDAGSRMAYQKPRISAAPSEDIPTPNGVPGTFPISPQTGLPDSSATTRPVQVPPIKRKPVGNPSRTHEDPLPEKQISPQDSTDTVIKRPFVTQSRSSSAPVPRSFNFETPDDVGKDSSKALPSVPREEIRQNVQTRQHIEIEEPFLGQQRPPGEKNVPGSETSAPFRPEKELPCLPTNNGLFQWQASEQAATLTAHNMAATNIETRRMMAPRGGDPAYPYVRNTRMAAAPRRYYITSKTSTGANIRAPTMPIPTYDNPPSQMTKKPRPMRGVVGGPRPMYQPRSVSENIKRASEIFTGPPATMSTRTHIPTHISTLQPRLQGRSHRMALGFEMNNEQKMYQPVHDRVYPNDPREWNRNTSNIEASAPPRSRPRAQSRPQMPDRADAHMRSIPRVSPQPRNQQETMEVRHQWRMTGTSDGDVSERSGASATSMTDSEIDRKLVPSPLRPHVEQILVAHTSFRNDKNRCEFLEESRVNGSEQGDQSSQSSGLTRKCSRCLNGFVAGSLRSIAGRTLTSVPKAAAEEVKERKNAEFQQKLCNGSLAKNENIPVFSSASIDEEVDEQDHTACCTECCTIEDCHEGCLGHPSPSVRSLDGATFVSSVGNPSTPQPEPSSPSTSAPTSTNSSPLKNRISFVQGLRMRKTLRTRQCPDDGKTIKERCNVLDSPPIELDSHPLSPGAFWGGGDDAAFAAKKALGVRKRAATTPNNATETATNGTNANAAKRVTSPPRLVIPKIRDLRSHSASEASNATPTLRASRCRNVSAASNLSNVTSASRSRNASGASTLSIEIPHFFSSLGTFNVVAVLEMLWMPFEAAAMWIRTHPEAQQMLWSGFEKGVEMVGTIVKTGGAIWEVSYVYSKTGSLRYRAAGGIGGLVVDCGRSVGYLLVFVVLIVCVGRVLGFLLGMAQGIFCVVRAVVWVVKKLGLGVFC